MKDGLHWRHGGRRWIHFSVTNEDTKDDDGMDDIGVEVKSYWKAEHFLHKERSKSLITELKG